MPQLRIKKAILLQQQFPFDEGIDLRVQEMQSLVFPYEVLEHISGLKYSQDVIDVYVHGQPGACSEPMLIGKDPHMSSSQMMVHELIHRLLSDNNLNINEDQISPKLYPNESEMCAKHVFIHAFHEYLYREVFESVDLLKADKKSCQSMPDYKRAWEIVEKEGYQAIIKKWRDAILNISNPLY